ncbi:hypothetical protein AHiyo6_07640 [Arthrobacter sp. Hiyo6]|nr:hypothetical protein AHiyo6_07640 [Arthrobacter sp. Hiyo6]
MQTLVVPLLPDFPKILASRPTTPPAGDRDPALQRRCHANLSRSADMYGKRKMMVVCLAIMVAGSVLAAWAAAFSG